LCPLARSPLILRNRHKVPRGSGMVWPRRGRHFRIVGATNLLACFHRR
jgi:hypothetical protein